MLRSSRYLTYIRSQPCCECFKPAEHAHHHGRRGTGQKASDTFAVPLCVSCHAEFHTTGTIEGQPRLKLDAHFNKTMVTLLTAYLEQEGIRL